MHVAEERLHHWLRPTPWLRRLPLSCRKTKSKWWWLVAANETFEIWQTCEKGRECFKRLCKIFRNETGARDSYRQGIEMGTLLSEREDPTGDLCVSQRQMRLDGAKLAPEWMPVQVYTLTCSLYAIPPGIDKQNILALRIDIIKVRSRHSHLPNCVITEQQPLPIIQPHQPAQQQPLR